MLIYTLRRINLLLFTLLLLSFFAYWLEYELGVDEQTSLWSGYLEYLRHLFAGDLGISSLSGRPALEMIAIHFPATFELCLSALIIAFVVGVTLGTLAALNQGKPLDIVISSFSVLGSSMPVYWLALLLILIFSMTLGLLPSSGQLNLLYEIEPVTGLTLVDTLLSQDGHQLSAFYNALQHLCLPAAALALLPTTEITRLVRNSMIDVLKQNYIKAAFSRGWSPWRVITRHALRNALPPIFPMLSMQFGAVVTSAIIIEMIFEWPGLGRWLIACIMGRDYVAIQAGLLVISSVLAVLNISTELLTNLLYPVKRKELYGQQG